MRSLMTFGLGFLLVAMCGALELNAKSAIIVEEKTGKVLFQKDADAIRFPASTTKILTALITLERLKPDTLISAPKECETIDGSKLYLLPGEVVSAYDMVLGMMLRSANDACYAVAVHLAGSEQAFAKIMNERAKELGCENTHFVTSNGLHDDRHYTTARDLSLIAREAMKNAEFRQIVSKRRGWITRSINKKDEYLISKNVLLDEDPTMDGIKTGFTRVAGSTFVGSATREGFRIITVIMNSEDWKADQKAMVDWAFKNYKVGNVVELGETVSGFPLPSGEKATVPAIAAEAVSGIVQKVGKPGFSVEFLERGKIDAPIRKGEPLGMARLSDGKGWSAVIPVVAGEDVQARQLLSGNWSFAALGGALVGLSLLARKKSRRMYDQVGIKR